MLNLDQLSSHRGYLLAISGGRDSVCLLHSLLEKEFRELHLVHLNHQLRGQESENDAHFVQKLAKQLQLPLTLESTPVADLAAQTGTSLETAARNARHQLFAKVARETNCPRVLLAHHAEDQAETCLFNLLRGSSGIKGMAPESEFLVEGERLTLLRPLLRARRSEIDAYLDKNKISFREDLSNQENIYTRNRLRNEALPLLESILQRDIVPSLIRAEEATRENEFIIKEYLEAMELRDPQGRLFLPKLRNLSPELQRACLKSYLAHHQVEKISRPLLDSAIALIAADGPPKLNLPGSRFLRRKEGRIFLI